MSLTLHFRTCKTIEMFINLLRIHRIFPPKTPGDVSVYKSYVTRAGVPSERRFLLRACYRSAHSQSSSRFFPELVFKAAPAGTFSFTGKALRTSGGTPSPPCSGDGHSCGSASPGRAPGGRTPACTRDRRRLGEDGKVGKT